MVSQSHHNQIILEDLRVVIIGIGLMGGSLARAIRPFVSQITAVDPNQHSLDLALAAGVIDRGTVNLAEGLTSSDLIILASPVRTILDMLEQLPALCPGGRFIFDLGSTKGDICAAMDRLPATFQAIGGHPMCGKEHAGFAHSDVHLYQGKTFILCRTARTAAEIEQIALKIVELTKGRCLFLPPGLHDELVSLTSHLPYIVSAVLMRQAAEMAEEQKSLWQVSASGFRDSSRLSGSSPVIMGDILLTNRTAVLSQLHRYKNQVEELIYLLESESDTALLKWLDKAQQEYRAYKQFVDSS